MPGAGGATSAASVTSPLCSGIDLLVLAAGFDVAREKSLSEAGVKLSQWVTFVIQAACSESCSSWCPRALLHCLLGWVTPELSQSCFCGSGGTGRDRALALSNP